jgi:hypothetical protein
MPDQLRAQTATATGVLRSFALWVREQMRPLAAPCRECALADRCPKTWALYLEMFGSGELTPVGVDGAVDVPPEGVADVVVVGER